MNNNVPVNASNRIGGLDALRGIAALIVVFTHMQLIGFADFHGSFFQKNTFVNYLTNGRVSVLLFFVLSGFVLSLPHFTGRALPYKQYIIRRFCRIYLPFLFSILVAGFLWWSLADAPHTEYFPWDQWAKDINLKSFLSHIFLSGITDSAVLNGPIWTLVMELRVAIVFPVLVLAVRKLGVWAAVLSIVMGYAAAKLFVSVEPKFDPLYAETFLGTLFLTFYYVQFFVFGIIIAARLDSIKKGMRKIPTKIHMAIGILLFLVPISAFTPKFTIQELYLSGLSCYLIMCCITFDKFNDVLMLKPLQWLGRVSFSLYLMHVPVLYVMMYLLQGIMPVYAIFALSLPIMFVVAHITYRWIEKPSMNLGKKWAPTP